MKEIKNSDVTNAGKAFGQKAHCGIHSSVSGCRGVDEEGGRVGGHLYLVATDGQTAIFSHVAPQAAHLPARFRPKHNFPLVRYCLFPN